MHILFQSVIRALCIATLLPLAFALVSNSNHPKAQAGQMNMPWTASMWIVPGCTGQDYFFSLVYPPYPTGAGKLPTLFPAIIENASVSINGDGAPLAAGDYIVLGEYSPRQGFDGDITPQTYGPAPGSFSNLELSFDPVLGDDLHIHYQCQPGEAPILAWSLLGIQP